MPPTKEEIKEFWEWCGFEKIIYLDTSNKPCASHWVHPMALGGGCSELPEINLNNLFKYAVPKMASIQQFQSAEINIRYQGNWWVKLIPKSLMGCDYDENTNNDNLALALFWAIQKVFKEK
jgi:hypothetical protein